VLLALVTQRRVLDNSVNEKQIKLTAFSRENASAIMGNYLRRIDARDNVDAHRRRIDGCERSLTNDSRVYAG